MSKALVVGSTGLVGSFILSTLRTSPTPQFAGIEIVTRRSPPVPKDAAVPVNEFLEKDTTKWAAHVSSLSPVPTVAFSSLGTTRAAAGGLEQQYKLDHDLTLDIAKAAKAAGTKTYVLISSGGSNPKSMFAYMKMKGEIEEHVKELGFEHTIILRPGLLVGKREQSRLVEGVLRGVASALNYIHSSLKDFWAQDAETVARAAVSAAMKVEKGEVKDKVWVLEQKDIVRLGSKEWKA
jgi:uncharacterized protein YbjT (DUF2867 family)